MSEVLKPCPFCGGEKLDFQLSFIDGWIVHVECTSCDDMTGPMSAWKYDEKDEAKADAAETWNTRADTNAEMLEALDEMAQILGQCTFETMHIRGQYIDRKEVVSRARAVIARVKGGDA